PVNVYVENHLEGWQVKLLITCRPSALRSEDRFLFLPYQVHTQAQATEHLLREYYLLPFNPQQIERYLAAYLTTAQAELSAQVAAGALEARWLEEAAYREALQTLPGLAALIQTPFLLRLAIEALPVLSQQYQTHTASHVQLIDLYETFFTRFRVQQQAKLPP